MPWPIANMDEIQDHPQVMDTILSIASFCSSRSELCFELASTYNGHSLWSWYLKRHMKNYILVFS